MALVALALGAALWRVGSGHIEIPPRFNPWAPIDPMETPGLLTGFKLSRARGEPAACLAALDRTGMQYETVPDRTTGAGCGFDNAVRLRSAPIRFGPPLPLSCPMALSFFMWERHALQPAAQRHAGERVVAIEHLGSYACRNINRGEGAVPGASRSRHATANALDISALVLADGRQIAVARHWRANAAAPVIRGAEGGAPPPADAAAALLRDSFQGGCRFFDGALGPDYNAAHRDHFHFETGGYRMCR